jgi:hypothetical protein
VFLLVNLPRIFRGTPMQVPVLAGLSQKLTVVQKHLHVIDHVVNKTLTQLCVSFMYVLASSLNETDAKQKKKYDKN